jgi:hypothetical protein
MSDFYDKTDNYEIPSTSNYMSWEDGDNKFRILGAFSEGTAIQGMEYWKTVGDKRTPIRYGKQADGTYKPVPMSELEVNKFGNLDTPKYFWALPVWNYQDKKVQILEITQKSILKSIQQYIGNKKWGDPRDYDIIVNKGKEGDKTVYTVTVDPKEDVEQAIFDQYIQTKINIKALFKGEDPFEVVDDEEAMANSAIAAGL